MMGKKEDRFMVPARFRFTLRQAGLLVAVCAVAFALLRTPTGAFLLVLIGPVLPGFIIDRVRGGRGFVGGMLSAAITSAGYWLVCYLYAYFFHDLADMLEPAPLPFLMFLLIMSLIWGIFVSILLTIVLNVTSPILRKSLTEDACGPVVCREFSGDRQPSPAASRGSWMKGNHA
jgi:hypothetical protein